MAWSDRLARRELWYRLASPPLNGMTPTGRIPVRRRSRPRSVRSGIELRTTPDYAIFRHCAGKLAGIVVSLHGSPRPTLGTVASSAPGCKGLVFQHNAGRILNRPAPEPLSVVPALPVERRARSLRILLDRRPPNFPQEPTIFPRPTIFHLNGTTCLRRQP